MGGSATRVVYIIIHQFALRVNPTDPEEAF
jgi:hypothetical protein